MTTQTLKKLVETAEAWPPEDQEELADYARVIEARRRRHYVLTEAERAAIEEGLDEADRGEFVPDSMVAEADKRHDS